ncbi:GNAT family N-acetyltransferase [Nocardioides donggukensis]|uniref:GNAT family N-acetyltransferase n=1 Tax=Nocardioides donggukensis TaxID=2774019 RepID=A0A927PZ50_9ACTN|nr:GNAT family N-acetyltransferase [Nocardioides donggukensis]MBD8868440.1 GNAT family N-acetyltransferase [Nocardioides donggukensis]
MTDNPVRVGRASDPQRYVATDQTVWFAEVPDASPEQLLVGLAEEHRYAAEVDGADPGTYPGVYGVFPLRLAVPGPGAAARQVPCAGLTWVGVHPDHRRKGVLTAMLRHHLEQVHEEEGTHVSALHASEPAIYGRYGYGLASLELEVTLSRGATLTAPHLDAAAGAVTTQFATISDADVPERMHACHLAQAEPGAVVGDAGYYARICTQLPEELRDKESWRVLFARQDGADVGFAMFRRAHKWERGRTAGELTVWAVVGDPAARLALLRRLVDFDLMGTVKIGTVGVDDPLLHWAGGPRATADIATYDSLWVRLVDLPEALQARAWSAPCDVVVEVADTAAPWNAGTWRIRADGAGQATVERTTAEAEVALPVEALGAAYLGGSSLVALLRAGQLTERRTGAVAELWRGLRTDVAPTAAVGF